MVCLPRWLRRAAVVTSVQVVLAGFTAAAVAAPGDINTVAGTGTAGFSGDGGPATSAQINNPVGVDVTPDGGFLIADFGNNVVRRVSVSGTITTVAGDGSNCPHSPDPCGDGGPATSAQLNGPSDVAATADGGFLIADSSDHRIRKVSATGTITTVAGTGALCSLSSCNDGGPATAAQFVYPTGVVTTADGGFLIADSTAERIRKVSAAGTITTVAGDGSLCSSPTDPCGDGGPATSAQLNTPYGVGASLDGGVLIADTNGHRIRKVSATGMITTIAGDGTACSISTDPCGDGGPATSAQLNTPWGVAASLDGGVLLADLFDNRIRKVSAAGTITTVAGDGTSCSSPTDSCGDGGSATSAQLNYPQGIAAAADGGFLIADSGNSRIRRVAPTDAQATPEGKISARGTVETEQGPSLGFSAANDCNPTLSTRPSIVATIGGGRIWTKTHVTASSCTDQPPTSSLGFDTQTGTATGTFGAAAPSGRNGQTGTLQWTYFDSGPDSVQFTLRDSSNTIVYQVDPQRPTAYFSSSGGVWTFGP